jgi:RNA-binding protein 39
MKPIELPEPVDGPMRIYVSGLTDNLSDITDSDIRSIFYPFGDIEFIDIPKDPNTLKSTGICYILFRKGSQAKSAINSMNGFFYKGKVLKVGVSQESGRYMALGDEDNNYLSTYTLKQSVIQKLSRDAITTHAYEDIQSACVQMSNLFDPNEVDMRKDPHFYKDLEVEMKRECNQFGKVDEVISKSNSGGCVWVKYADNNTQAAKVAVNKFNGR